MITCKSRWTRANSSTDNDSMSKMKGNSRNFKENKKLAPEIETSEDNEFKLRN